MTINESIGTVCTDESRPQLCRQSSWLFLRRPLLYFRWPLQSQEGLCMKTKPSVRWGSSFSDDFRVGSVSVFGVDFRVHWDCVRWPIQASAIILVDYFWVVSYTVLSDDYRDNRDWACRENQASAGEAVLVMIFESAMTQFSMSISESTRTVCADHSRRQLWRQSRSLFYEMSATSFSVTTNESTGTVCTNKSRPQRYRQSRWIS